MGTKAVRTSTQYLVLGVALLFALGNGVRAAECPFPGQTAISVVQLFFGQDIKGRGQVPANAWKMFLQQTVTPRFTDGFTVYDGYGQWMNPATHRIGREKTRIVEIAIGDMTGVPEKIAELTKTYRERFHQQSVGVVTTQGCGAF